MHAAVGPAPVLGHPASKQDSALNFSRFSDVISQRSGYLGRPEFRGQPAMQGRVQEEGEEMEEDEEEAREEGKEDVGPAINNHNDNNNSNHTEEKVCDLSSKVAELHATLEALRRESEQKIEKLHAENEEATRAIERLQQQLKEQSGQNQLKNNLMNLKDGPLAGGMNPFSLPQPHPGGSQLEMFLLGRAKALNSHNPHLNGGAGGHHAGNPFGNPAGNPFGSHPGFPMRSSLFPGPLPTSPLHPMEMAGGKDLLARWRQSLPPLPLPPTIQESPSSPSPPCRSPEKRETGSPDRPPSSAPSDRPTMSNGDELRGSECGTPSPRHTDSISPGKSEAGSPGRETSLTMSPYGGSLSIPSILPSTSSGRIPKADPMEGRLQDMLRYNMDRDAGLALDTLGDSRRVRELLTVHNIGQRLFAKYVLGLSQGTVSELLSKPKSWDKLTEKGRDSYRKMHAWVWDDQAILLLKTLIPRKGELLRSSSSVKQGTWHLTQPISRDAADPGADDLERADREDRSSEHRINKILSEVNKSHENLLPKFPIPLELTGAGQGLPMPALPPAPGPDDLKLALTFYQAEINQLKKMPSTNPDHFDALAGRPGSRGENVEEESDKEEEERKEEKENQEEDRSRIPAGHASPFSMLQFPRGPPIFPGGPGFLVSNGIENPLQMMASITNSLVSQPLPTGMTNNAMKMKAVLPPITQQQFDHFSHLNTDQTVSRIKEILSQYSISQRLFGEAVLGLSQGSVSDLLARPKPWHMLTQKGREPFIRMKLFLDDDTAIHKLVASQYKIVPDKLLRQGAYSGKPVMPLVPGMPGMLPAGLQARLGEGFRGLGDGSPLPALIPNSRLPPQILPGIDRSLLSSLPGLGSPRLGLPSSLGLPHLTPNLYEMAALTQEFDTSHITNKVKELLLANNTGQKLFGEAVLGLSQGSVSELLSKPKPWHMLSIKGREPFIRMQLWLNDPANMDKLLAIKKLQEDSRKRKRTFDESFSGKSSPSDISDLYSNPGGLRSPSEEAKRAREGGLDLSFRREEEEASEGEREEEGRPEEEGRDMSESDDGTPRPNGGGRSRRKPAAPQWVNPTDWSGEEHREDMDSKTINGVCVMNTSAVFQPAPDPAD